MLCANHTRRLLLSVRRIPASYPVSLSTFGNNEAFRKVLQVKNKDPTLPCYQYINMRRYTPETVDIETSFHVQTVDDFASRVLHAKIPIIVDFHAEWCGPCKQLGPRLDKEVDRYSGDIMVAKVDVDDFGEIAMKYKVMAVPSVMLFKNGEVVDSFQGNVDDDELIKFVERSLEKK